MAIPPLSTRSPTFLTPVRPAESRRTPLRGQQEDASDHAVSRLSTRFKNVTINVWNQQEIEALVEFVQLMSGCEKWPCHKNMKF